MLRTIASLSVCRATREKALVTWMPGTRVAMVEKIEAGPKGATISFRHKAFSNARGLIRLITDHSGTMKVRPDQTLVVMRDWPTPEARLKGAETLLSQLARLAEAA